MNRRKYWLTWAIALTLSSRAHASGQQLCDGWKTLPCAPMAGAMLLAPTPSSKKIEASIEAGDLRELKALLSRHPKALTTDQLLSIAVFSYLHPERRNSSKFEANEAAQLDIIDYLLQERTDITKERLNKFLVRMLYSADLPSQARLINASKRLIAHGASYAGLNLSDWAKFPKISNELLTFMSENGANPDEPGRVE